MIEPGGGPNEVFRRPLTVLQISEGIKGRALIAIYRHARRLFIDSHALKKLKEIYYIY